MPELKSVHDIDLFKFKLQKEIPNIPETFTRHIRSL